MANPDLLFFTCSLFLGVVPSLKVLSPLPVPPGESTVNFQCVEETDLILIHSNKLNYTKQDNQLARLSGADAPSIKSSWLELPTQYLVIQLEGKLVKGNTYSLNTMFTGELADDLGGFYRSEYKENGVTK